MIKSAKMLERIVQISATMWNIWMRSRRAHQANQIRIGKKENRKQLNIYTQTQTHTSTARYYLDEENETMEASGEGKMAITSANVKWLRYKWMFMEIRLTDVIVIR